MTALFKIILFAVILYYFFKFAMRLLFFPLKYMGRQAFKQQQAAQDQTSTRKEGEIYVQQVPDKPLKDEQVEGGEYIDFEESN